MRPDPNEANANGFASQPTTNPNQNNIMKTNLRTLIQTVACALVALALSAQADDKKPDPSGTWTWSTTGQDGTARTSTAKLKMEGEKLTGTVTGRQTDTAIENGKLAGDEISFSVTREFNGNKITTKYAGKISGDSIKGKISSERDGKAQSRDWEAKRSTEKK